MKANVIITFTNGETESHVGELTVSREYVWISTKVDCLTFDVSDIKEMIVRPI